MPRSTTIFPCLLVLLGVATWLLIREDRPSELGKTPLVVHCAAGLTKPVTELARQYEKEFGVPIRLQLGGSGALEISLDVAGGDLYIPADYSYIESEHLTALHITHSSREAEALAHRVVRMKK